MRFKHKPSPKDGDIRYKVFFAWLPVTIGLETRWLERISIKQEFHDSIANNKNIDYFSFRYRVREWINKAFEQQPLPDFKTTIKTNLHIFQE